jgi:uncharacterized MnhB-related membrane protein
MSLLEAVAYALVAVMGAAVVFTKRPASALLVYSGFGITLTLLFFVLHAPDVAFSELAVGTLVLPMIVLVALMKTGDVP